MEKEPDLANHIKGTTAIAIRIFIDSRESNEGAAADVRDCKWKAKIYNTTEKWYDISNKIVALIVGSKKHNFDLRASVTQWAEDMRKIGNEIEVSAVAYFIETELCQLPQNDKKVYQFGTIIAGHDKTKGLQIYRVYIVGKEVRNEKIRMFASFGTGSTYARHRMVDGYNPKSTDEDVKKLGYNIVLDASFYDKNTDGNINYLLVNKNGWAVKESVETLKAYQTYYEKYDEGNILFMVHSAKDVIPTDDLIELFRQYGDIIISHCVDHRLTTANKEFYFHRLVFVSKVEARKALTALAAHPLLDKYKCSTILSQFDYELDCSGITLFLQESSKQLLDYIISNSTMKLDVSPTPFSILLW